MPKQDYVLIVVLPQLPKVKTKIPDLCFTPRLHLIYNFPLKNSAVVYYKPCSTRAICYSKTVFENRNKNI